MSASHKIKAPSPDVASPAAWEAMADPLHPMHQQLLQRMSGVPTLAPAENGSRWSRPARFAALFYLGLGSWAMVGGLAYLIARLI